MVQSKKDSEGNARQMAIYMNAGGCREHLSCVVMQSKGSEGSARQRAI